MKNNLISIIISHKNEGYLLDITLDSIYFKAKYLNYEIIIIDDGSDNYSDLDFLKTHPLRDKIRLYKQNGLGISKARNLGAKYANGDILVFIDSHIYFIDDFLSKVNECFQNTNISICKPQIRSRKQKKENPPVGYFYNFLLFCSWTNIKNDSEKYFNEIPSGEGCCFIIRKCLFDKLGGFNYYMKKRGSEDQELSILARLYGEKIYYNSDIIVAHYVKLYDSSKPVEYEVIYNCLMLALTLFDGIIKDRVLESIKESFEDYYNKAYIEINSNIQIIKYIKQRATLKKKHDKDYFSYFKSYYPDFIELINSNE